MKTAFVLEGGAMRGIYTAGVLDVFWEQQILPEGIIGVSAGAIHGSSFISGQPGRSIRYYKKYSKDKRFFSFRSLVTTGAMVGEDFCYHVIPEQLDPFDFEAFTRSPIDFYAACTNLKSGQAEYLLCKDLRRDMDIMRASASMPYVSPIVPIGGKKYLDGGVADSIPVEAAEKLGYDRRIVVCTRPKGYRKKAARLSLARRMYRAYPAFITAIAQRHLHYNQTMDRIEQLEQKGTLFVLRPSEDLEIRRTETDPIRLTAQYELGRRDAAAKLNALRLFLGKEG